MAKDKKEKRKSIESKNGTVVEDVEAMEVDTTTESRKEMKEVPPEAIAPIAHPLAEKKLAKRLLKTIKKASKAKHVKRGVKEVVKGLRKGDKG